MLDLVGTSVLVWLKQKDGRRLLGTFGKSSLGKLHVSHYLNFLKEVIYGIIYSGLL